MSLDGKIARPHGESQWLTGTEARKRVHALRAEVEAIIVGGETVRQDDPSLTIRDVPVSEHKQQPYRVVLTRDQKSLPASAKLFTDEHKDRTLVYENMSFLSVLKKLAELDCTSVLLECGGNIMGQWFDQSLVDECYFFLAPMICGGDKLAVAGCGASSNESSIHLSDVTYEKIGNDLLSRGLVDR